MASMTKKPTTGEVPGNAIDSHHPHASAPFLRLPPEVRNRIYKYALRLEIGICEVNETTGFPQPALLFTCKDIRREAIAILYSVNTIRPVIESYSPSMPIFMHKERLAVLTKYGYKIPAAEASTEGLARWRNLLFGYDMSTRMRALASRRLNQHHRWEYKGAYVRRPTMIRRRLSLLVCSLWWRPWVRCLGIESRRL
jgi:hypothetical protein